MNWRQKTATRGEQRAHVARVVVALTAAGVAAAAATVLGGISAVATVETVNAAPHANQLPPSARPAEAPTGVRTAPSDTADERTKTTKDATGRGNALNLGPMPPAPVASKASVGAGDAPEVSLAEAGRAEAGPAARHPGGGNPTGLKQRGPVDPGEVLTGASGSLGGCLAEYGAPGQCLPAVPPSMSRHFKEMKDAGLDPGSMTHSWTCTEVRTYFETGLPLRQAHVDPQRLDSNQDGVACGPTD